MPKYFVDKFGSLQVGISDLIPPGSSLGKELEDPEGFLTRLSIALQADIDKLKKNIDDQKILEDGVYLSDLNPRDKIWDKHRANADQVSKNYSVVNNLKYSQRILDCAKKLEFVLKETNKFEEKLFKLINAKFCRVRLCPVCQWRRSLKMFARFAKLFPRILEAYPEHKFLFLTLTVKNCSVEDLRETVTKMNKAFVLFTKRKMFPGIGWVKSVEVTRGVNGFAHPHFHVILMVLPSYFSGTNYISKEKWWKLWKDCLSIDYDPVIDIRRVKDNKNSIESALCEVLKYSVKEVDLLTDPQWLQAITEQLHKTRALSTGGVFKQYLAELEKEVTEEEMLDTGLEEEQTSINKNDPRFWFGWREMVKKYQSE